MPRRRTRDLSAPWVDGQVEQRDELAGRDLADHDLVRSGEKASRLWVLARERAEDELRHGHVRGRVDPVTRHVAEHYGEAAVRKLEEVVHVAAHFDARRRGVER